MILTYIKQGTEPVGDGGDQYTGWDRFSRVIDQRWIKTRTGTDLERIQYGFDQASNRQWRKNVVAASGQDEYYTYDGLYQLKNLDRGTLTGNPPTGISGTPAWEEDFSFDPTGNWNNYVTKASGSTTLNQNRTHNKANEILTIAGSGALITQNAAGNITKTPKPSDWSTAYDLTYDAWHRLVKVMDGANTVATYAYDGHNRRTTKATSGTTRHYYYSNQWQILEERVGTNTTAERQFVWGLRYIDDLILRDRGSERLYSLHDYFNCTAVVDASGTVQERYGYDAFGKPRFMTPAFGSRSASLYEWETLYAAYRWDGESGLYQVRFRYLHPGLGRWVSRDPLHSDEMQLVNRPVPILDDTLLDRSDVQFKFNLYLFVKNAPLNFCDYSGLVCYCGVDVGNAINASRQDMTSRFQALDRKKKWAACEPYWSILHDPTNADAILRGSKGWDLYDMVWRWQELMKGKTCGGCPDTVTIRDKCYNKWDANYYSFGVLVKLCGLGYTDVRSIVTNWKRLPSKWKDDAEAAISFGEWGYMGTDANKIWVATAKDLSATCTLCPEKYASHLRSTWPLASTTR